MTLPTSRSPWLVSLVAASLLACTSAPEQARAAAPAAPAAPAKAAVAAPVAAPEVSTLERLLELGRGDNRVQDHLQYLCLEIGPRLTGSSQLQAACEWTRERFASFGLEAQLERWGEFAVGFDRGPWRGGMVAPEAQEFVFHTMSWTPGTNGAQRGPALAYPTTEDELTALGDKLAGAWLVRPPAGELKNEAGEVVFAKPAQPSNELVQKVQKLITEKGGLGEVRGSRSELLVTGGDQRVEWNALPKLVSIRVRKDQHDGLWTRMQKGEAVELEFDVHNTFVQGPIPQYNVVADLVGSEKPDEFVIVSGHLDSWDGAQGTVDNGTGCATTLEAARLLTAAGAKPKRTIRFILWTGEEQGLFGSENYVKQHADLLPKISVVLVHDGGTNYLSGLTVPHAMFLPLQEALAPLVDLNTELPFQLKQAENLPSQVGSDNDSFVAAGVPGLFWDQAGRSDYDHYHHTQYDTFDAAIPEYQKHSALVIAIAALRIADLPTLLDRTNMKAPEPRRIGVQLDATKIVDVTDGGRAKAAGLLAGDVLLSIDGVELKSQNSVSAALRGGGSKKVVLAKRGEETLTFTFDWSDDPDEPRRLEQIKEREAKEAARKAERDAKKASETKEGSQP